MNLYNLLTKKNEDLLLLEAGVLNEDGRLSTDGRNLVTDLLFQGKQIDEIKKIIVEEIKKEKKNK